MPDLMTLGRSPHPSVADLNAFGLGRSTAMDAETIAEHLVDCLECRECVAGAECDGFVDLVRKAAESQPASPANSKRVVPGYEVLRELGRGGAGVVFLARQPGTGRLVALKQLRTGALASPEELSRFRREAESLARLDHPNIVRVYESGEQEGIPYLALEFVRGLTLAEKLITGVLAPQLAAELVEIVARGVEYSHGAGIIHRDLKPGNILLQPDPDDPQRLGIPKITDFGLARTLDTVPQTLSGALLGTPAYMAPEQINGSAGAVGPRTDVFALGAILYESLTTKPPFRGETVVDTLDLVRNSNPVPPSQIDPGIPPDLETICLKCLEKSASDRYPSAGALADDLRRFLNGEPIHGTISTPARSPFSRKSRPTRRILLSFTFIAMLTVCFIWWNVYTGRTAPSEHEFAVSSISAASRASPVMVMPTSHGLALWLRADQGIEIDSMGGVRRWSDQSPGGDHDALQLMAVNRPQWITDNDQSHSALRFDGVDDSLDLEGQVLEAQEFTIFAIITYSNHSGKLGARSVLSNWSYSNQTHSVFLGVMDVDGVFPRFTDELGGQTDTNIQVTRRSIIETPKKLFHITVRSSNTNAEIYTNSQLVTTANRPLDKRNLAGLWRVGSHAGAYEFWSGDIMEILAYDRALDDAELKSVWKYLHQKFSPRDSP